MATEAAAIMTTKSALTMHCLFAGNESWMDLNLQLSTREGDRLLLDAHHRMGALTGMRLDAIHCHYRRPP